MRLTKFNSETGEYEYIAIARTQEENNARRKAVLQRLGEFEDKASDVAEEIFAEIEKRVKSSLTVHLEEINKEHIKDTPLYDRHSGIIFAWRDMDDFIAELKKKYIGKDTNVTTNAEEWK